MAAKFGPAGNGESFKAQGFKHTYEAPKWLAGMGLTAYEYQCGRGITISEESAAKIGEEAAENGIAMSLHSPYFINLSSAEPERIQKNTAYITESCRIVRALGGRRVVVHCGGLSGKTRDEAFQNTLICLDNAINELHNLNLDNVLLCVETMGKINVFGTLEEVCEVCKTNDMLIPCIDFGHLNARTLGGLKTKDDFTHLFDAMENIIGIDKAKNMHAHFSKIEYSNGGEVRHLTFADTEYGPDFEYPAEIMAKRGYNPVVICESAGTQAEDAVTLKEIYQKYI